MKKKNVLLLSITCLFISNSLFSAVAMSQEAAFEELRVLNQRYQSAHMKEFKKWQKTLKKEKEEWEGQRAGKGPLKAKKKELEKVKVELKEKETTVEKIEREVSEKRIEKDRLKAQVYDMEKAWYKEEIEFDNKREISAREYHTKREEEEDKKAKLYSNINTQIRLDKFEEAYKLIDEFKKLVEEEENKLLDNTVQLAP